MEKYNRKSYLILVLSLICYTSLVQASTQIPTSQSPEDIDQILPIPTPLPPPPGEDCEAPRCRVILGSNSQINSCLCCAGDLILTEHGCACEANKVQVGDVCACPEGSEWNGTECVPPLCQFYRLNIASEGPWGLSKTGRGGLLTSNIESSFESWLISLISNLQSVCYNVYPPYWYNLEWNGLYYGLVPIPNDFIDDCVAHYFLRNNTFAESTPGQPRGSYTPLAKSAYYCEYYTRSYVCSYDNATIIFDKNFNSIDRIPAEAEVCDTASYYYRVSPVSLIWDDSYDVDSEITVSNFPVNPTEANKWYLWKASAKAPLLVYDPMHLGRITNGTQLFGNWTFGGKGLAALGTQSNSDTAPKSTQWENGFQALATLDGNGDNKLSDGELDPLSLWFDGNQDGVSQPGEVRTLAEEGVIAVYFKPDSKDPLTKSLFVNLGYSRIVKGQVINGRAVDWYTYSANSASELIANQAGHGALCDDKSRANRSHSTKNETRQNPTSEPSELYLGKNNISGIWSWRASGKDYVADNFAPQGLFTFSESVTGVIKGHSYGQVHFRKDFQDASSILLIRSLEGKRDTSVAGQRKFQFSTSEDKGVIVKNTAQLSEDGNTIYGVSEAIIKYPHKPITVKYSWTATRYAS